MLATDVRGPHTILRATVAATCHAHLLHQSFTSYGTRVSVNVNRCYRGARARTHTRTHIRRWTYLLLPLLRYRVEIRYRRCSVNSVTIRTRSYVVSSSHATPLSPISRATTEQHNRGPVHRISRATPPHRP
jgi:hypothetical protein